MAMIEHTSGEWKADCNPRGIIGNGRDICQVWGNFEDEEADANARLIALAPTAPHECPDPACPGHVNWRKLAAIDELLTIKRLSKYLVAYINAETVSAKDWKPITAACNELRDAVAKVEELE